MINRVKFDFSLFHFHTTTLVKLSMHKADQPKKTAAAAAI